MKTSGSTGNPLIVYINSNEDLIRKAKHIRSNKNLGQRIRDNWVTITGPHHFPQKTTTIQDLLNIYNPRPVSVFLDIESQISSIAKLKPVILEGYATSLYLLASYLEKKNSDIIKPRFIVSSAELLTDSDREKIESVFNVPVYDQYSCIEFGRVSWECEHRTGYHIDSDNLVVQFIDESGEEVGVGETGEIVCTSLFNYSMPLIRYSIGDYGSLSDEPCNCGITLPLMKHIEGRHDSIIVFPDGRKVSPRALSISMSMFKDYSNIQQFQIIQKKVDSIKVSLKLKQTINNNFCSDLTAHLYNVLSLDKEQINIDVELVENIPLSKTGKLFYIKSEVDSE
jgi:phenylacetate-CoA ligase